MRRRHRFIPEPAIVKLPTRIRSIVLASLIQILPVPMPFGYRLRAYPPPMRPPRTARDGCACSSEKIMGRLV